MALTFLNKGSNRSANFGASVGEGLGSLLNTITQEKMQSYLQNKRSERVAPLLEKLGLPRELAGLPQSSLDQVLKGVFNQGQQQRQNLMNQRQEQGDQQRQQQQQVEQQRQSFNRSSMPMISKYIRSLKDSGEEITPQVLDQLRKHGVSSTDLEIFSSDELTPEVARYFLNLTAGDEKKAKQLAKKYGFTV